jgi:N-acetylneuraminate synthase
MTCYAKDEEVMESSNLRSPFSCISVGDHAIGGGNSCFVIAEVAQSHEGSLGMAHAFIDSIAEAGADAVKFQTHIADAESTNEEPWRIKFSSQDRNRYAYWKRMEFTESQWVELKQHAVERNLVFISSPFSLEAAQLLRRVGVSVWKLASGEITRTKMFDYIVSTGTPIILSSGMSSWAELDTLCCCLIQCQVPFGVMQCTTAYPCPPEKIGLNVIAQLASRYGCPVGLSDHSGKIYSGLAACALGASMIEVHVTLSRRMFGPDVASSLTFKSLSRLVDGVQHIHQSMANPVDKDAESVAGLSMRQLFGKSVVLATGLPAGTLLAEENLAFKKPGTGIPAAEWRGVIGRRLKVDRPRDFILRNDDLD